MALPGRSRPCHRIETPRAPCVCDVCGETIPPERADSFTTLPKMYYDPPPSGFEPCNRRFDAMRVKWDA